MTSSIVHPRQEQILTKTPTHTSSFRPSFAIALVLIFAARTKSVFIIFLSFRITQSLS